MSYKAPATLASARGNGVLSRCYRRICSPRSQAVQRDHLRLLVSVIFNDAAPTVRDHFHSSDGAFQVLVEGSAEDCIAQLELEVMHRVCLAGHGFRLVLANCPAEWELPLTIQCMLEASLWGNSRLQIRVQLLMRSPHAPGSSEQEHGRWIHKAALRIQSRWRERRQWRQRVDIADVLRAFTLSLGSCGMHSLHPELLIDQFSADTTEAKMPKHILHLTLAYAACERPSSGRRPASASVAAQERSHAVEKGLQKGCTSKEAGMSGSAASSSSWQEGSSCDALEPPSSSQFFRWLEARAASFCVMHLAVFQATLEGLVPGPRCFAVLAELTRALLSRLAAAFPWMLELSIVDEAERLAREAAESALHRASHLSATAMQQLFVKQVSSEMLSWALEAVEDTLSDLEVRFQDTRTAARIADMPCFRAVRAALSSLAPSSQRRWLVRVACDEEPIIMLSTKPGEHLGGVLRSALAFYDVENALLFTEGRGGAEPLSVETPLNQLEARGLFIRLVLFPAALPEKSFEEVVIQVVRALGPYFQLDREARVLWLPQPSQLKRRKGIPNLGDAIIMPAEYSYEKQYYHFVYRKQRKFLTARCAMAEVIRWLRQYGEATPDGLNWDTNFAQGYMSPEMLLKEVEELQGIVDRWESSSVVPRRPARRAWDFRSWQEDLRSWQGRTCAPSDLPALLDLPAQVLEAAHPLVESLMPQSTVPSSKAEDSAAALDGPTSVPAEASGTDEEAEARRRLSEYSSFFGTQPISTRGCYPGKASLDEDGESDMEEHADDKIMHHSDGPAMGHGVMMTAAALSAPMLVRAPRAAEWVGREIAALVNSNSVQLMSPILATSIGPVSSAITGASLGSLLGPMGTTVGALGGLVVGNSSGSLFGPPITSLALAKDDVISGFASTDRVQLDAQVVGQNEWKIIGHGTMSQVNGKMTLHHREVPPSPGLEGLIGVALLQAALRGVNNICAWNKDEMSGQDVIVSFCRDIRDGVLVYCTVSSAFRALSIVESRAAGTAVAHLCSMALHHPMSVMYGVLGAGWLVIKLTSYAQGQISWELLKSEAILAGSSTASAVIVSTLCTNFGVTIPGGIGLTLSASHAVGMCVYEGWRNSQQRYIEERLCRIAREVMGLAPGFTARELHTRWKILVRYAHPDRNSMPDAKTTMHIFTKCRKVLEDSLGLPRPPASRFERLLNYLWIWNAVDWLQRQDLPPAWKYRVMSQPLQQPSDAALADAGQRDERTRASADVATADGVSVVFSVQDTDAVDATSGPSSYDGRGLGVRDW